MARRGPECRGRARERVGGDAMIIGKPYARSNSSGPAIYLKTHV
jgi:hypothetical protein